MVAVAAAPGEPVAPHTLVSGMLLALCVRVHVLYAHVVTSAAEAHCVHTGRGVDVDVIGKPNSVLGEIIKAFVALKPRRQFDDKLRLALLGCARQKLGSAIAPKELGFTARRRLSASGLLPRTRHRGPGAVPRGGV
jgi:hypothetical protein